MSHNSPISLIPIAHVYVAPGPVIESGLEVHMTKEEFAEGWARRSSMRVEELPEQGLFAAPCVCEEEMCEGWQMVSVGNAHHLCALGSLAEEDIPPWAQGTVKIDRQFFES